LKDFEFYGFIKPTDVIPIIHVKKEEKDYALKIISCTEDNIPKGLMEGNIVQPLCKSRYICPVYGYFFQRFAYSYVYILMEYYHEGSLQDELKELKEKTKQFLSEYQIVKWMFDIVCGIEEIHNSKIIHRDIKPANLVLDKGHLRMIDFGTSKFRPSQLNTEGVGTYIYMAPEQMTKEYTFSVDLWSLGVVGYEMMTLQIPQFKIKSLDECMKDIPSFYSKSLINIIKQLLNPIPEERPSATIAKELIQVRLLRYLYVNWCIINSV